MQRELLTQPEVADLLAEEGAAGLGIFVAVNLYLAHLALWQCSLKNTDRT